MKLPLSAATPLDGAPAADAPLVAITGATGFIGRRLVGAFDRAGWRVRLLLRREPADAAWQRWPPQVVAGELGDAAALQRLVDGADAVVHLAGVVKAARTAHFFAVNRDGAARLAGIVENDAPHARFVLVSSLAAREPALSDYAASKQAGEAAVLAALGPRATVLRPPAVYGPGDRESVLLFRLAARRLVPLLGAASSRLAMLHVDDLARLIVLLAAAPPAGRVVTAADDQPQGYRWREIMAAAAGAVGNAAPRFVQAPPALLRCVALAGDLGKAAGSAVMLSSQKLRELRHADWSVAPDELLRLPGWTAGFDLCSGFADTVAWYRAAGWLGASALQRNTPRARSRQ